MEETREVKRHFSKMGWVYCVFSVLMLGIQTLTFAIVNASKPEWAESMNIRLLLSLFPFYIIGVPTTIFLLKKFVPAEAPGKHKIKFGHFLLAIIMTMSLFFIMNIAGNVLTGIISVFKPSKVDNAILDVVLSVNPFLNMFCTVLCAPIIEEYIFRKMLIDRTLRYGEGAAIVISGLMFGLFHGNLNQFMYTFTVGTFWAFIYSKTGKIHYTMILHAILNLMSGVIAPALLNGLNLEAYMAAAASGDPNQLSQTIMAALPQWIAYVLYMFVYFVMAITGIVLFAVYRKKLASPVTETEVPKGKRFKTFILNAGMLVYIVFWTVLLIIQLCS